MSDKITKLTQQSNNGNAEASYKLGRAYHFGQDGVERNLLTAMDYYIAANKQGDIPIPSVL